MFIATTLDLKLNHPTRMVLAVVIAVLSLLSPKDVSGSPTILAFDDLPAGYDLTNDGYLGLTWEVGNPGLNGMTGHWVTASSSRLNYPYSAPRNIINSAGSTLMGIQLPVPAIMSGAYFAQQGNLGPTSVRVTGYLSGQFVGITDWTPLLTPTAIWLNMNDLSGVDRIVVESTPAASSGAAAYGMDDLTFTYTPEPTALALSALAGFGLLLRRRRLD